MTTVTMATVDGVHLGGMRTVMRRRERFSVVSWMRNRGFKFIFMVTWFLLNAAVFTSVYYHYKYNPKYYYLRTILGTTLCVSRGSAALLNLNCAALLLPVCKRLATRLRSCQSSRRSLRKCLDHYRSTHVVFAVCVCIATVIHCTAHSFNAVRFSRGFNSNVPDVNVATFPGQNPCTMLLSTVAGMTGCGMLLILIFIVMMSLPFVRRERHNWFWMSHHAFFLFYILLICHPLGGILKEQCNTDSHIPGCVFPDEPQAEPMSTKDSNPRPEYLKMMPRAEPQPMTFNRTICREKPVFIAHTSHTWRFLLVPAVLYLLERSWRWIISRRFVTIEKLRLHPGDIMELHLYVSGFKAKPGQFVLLSCPAISHLEWHPFTLTSCPSASEATFGLHIKVCGDWTESLRRLLSDELKQTRDEDPYKELPRLHIAGPFGSPSQDVLKYRVSVCIAGGVGVTPFAAILHHLSTLEADDLSRLKLSRLYFVWICREDSHFQWLSEQINALKYKLWQMNKPDFLNLRLYATGTSRDTCRRDGGKGSVMTSLCCQVTGGRPNLADILNDVTLCNTGQDIGVFVCGPRKLSTKVQRLCNRQNGNKARLHFNKESFS